MTEDDRSKETTSIGSLGRRVTEAIVVAAIALAGVLGGAWFTLLTKDHELKIKLVEIGIGILRADPKENVTPARRWATEIIQQNSGVPFTEDEKKALLDNKLSYVESYDSTYTPDYGTATYMPSEEKPSRQAPSPPANH